MLAAPFLAGLVSSMGVGVQEQTGTPQNPDRALFITNCASCHGESGDGKGWTQLDRPARSFKDGGFSFGNTPEALFRTITHGIPGSPMASFASSLTEAERRRLAGYVISLGPEQPAVDARAAEVVVADRPVFVRGMLDPIAPTSVPRPRGLVVGTPSGFTFEYRADDVRLLGVRQGRFVERAAWSGRGGVALNMYGRVVHLVEGGDPAAPFQTLEMTGGWAVSSLPLVARLAATSLRPDGAWIEMSLTDASGRVVARVEESPSALGTSVGSGFMRRFHVRAGGSPFQMVVGESAADRFVSSGVHWQVRPLSDGTFLCLGVRPPRQGAWLFTSGGRLRLAMDPTEHGRAFDVRSLLLVKWNGDVRQALVREMGERR